MAIVDRGCSVVAGVCAAVVIMGVVVVVVAGSSEYMQCGGAVSVQRLNVIIGCRYAVGGDGEGVVRVCVYAAAAAAI